MSVQRFPIRLWASSSSWSSSGLHPDVFLLMLRWFCHRRRHCLPALVPIFLLISAHFFVPCCCTSRCSISSSSCVHTVCFPVGIAPRPVCWHKGCASKGRQVDG